VCVVSDALDALGLDGAVSGILPVWERARVGGRVVTMRTVPAAGRKSARHLGVAAIELAEPGDVIVIEQQAEGEPASATWGGLLSRAAQRSGVGGIVVDGACRDVDEIRELGFPVSARLVLPFTARRRFIEDCVGEPITIRGCPVASGDHVIADGSGVAFIRAADLEEVARQAGRLAAREHRMQEDLDRDLPPSVVMGRDYEDMIDGR
jgi:4-hydroxy-4-methyl-2-oxoglutarate aldolase